MDSLGPERRLAYRLIVFVIAMAAAFGFGLLAWHAPFATPELKAEDALARLAPRPARSDVVIVAMDDASVNRYGAVQSWPRTLLASGLRRVEAGKPNVVVFDLGLTQRTHRDDDELWETMANSRNVVLGMAFNADRASAYTPDDIRSLVFLEKFALAGNLTLGTQLQDFPYYLFEPPMSDFTGSARGVGVFDRETDPDGLLRRARLFYRSTVAYPVATQPLRGKFPQSQLNDAKPVALTNLAFVAALRQFNIDKDNVLVESGNLVRVTGNISPVVKIPIDDQGKMLIRYASPGAIPRYSFADVATGKVKSDVFADKVVLIGTTDAADPTTSIEATPTGPMPRVEVTANALSTILDRSYVEVVTTNRYHTIGTLIIVGLLTGLTLMLLSGVRAFAVTVLLLLAWLAACYGLFTGGQALLPILSGLFTILTTYVIALALSMGPFRPTPLVASPTYVAPPSDVVH